MHEKHLYEYAVIRVFPKVENDEFINVGVLLFCKNQKYLRAEIQVNKIQLENYNTELDGEQLINNLLSFEKIAKAEKNAGPIAQLEASERFRWLSAVRSSCIQTSRPHSGFSGDLDATFNMLFAEYVI